uniref:Elongation factor 1-delta n=1 Tax=Esox lucius TaxID=8010 RepID=A0A3P8ZCT4_ESOLU
MMPKRNPPCPVMDQSGPNLPPSCCQVDCTTEMAVKGGQRNGGVAASSSPESGSVNGNGDSNSKRSGKSRRRRKRSAQSDNTPAPVATESLQPPPSPGQEKWEEFQLGQGGSSHPPPTPAPVRDSPNEALLGLRSECGSVWLDRSAYEQAESLYQRWLVRSANGVMTRSVRSPSTVTGIGLPPTHPHTAAEEHGDVAESLQPAIPDSLAFPAPSPATPDEGYLSLVQTPQAAAPSPQTPVPASGQALNGLPRLPLELLRDVWLEKPLYDRAEANFYQSLYGNNRSPNSNSLGGGASASRSNPNAPPTSRCRDRPHSLVEEEEEVEEAAVVSQGNAEVIHSLRTIQEEEEPADVKEEEGVSKWAGGVSYVLHPDSERVWLDRGRYEAAESRFYGYHQNVPGESTKADRKGLLGQQDAGVSETSLLQPPPPPVAHTGPARDNAMRTAVDFLVQEKVWFDKPRYDEAERQFYERINGSSHPAQELGANSILQDIARARENIQKSLAGVSITTAGLICRLLPVTRSHLLVEDLRSALSKLECRVAVLEKSPATASPPAAPPCINGTSVQQQKASAPVEEEDDDDIDLFGSDEEEDEEAERLKEQRLKEYAEKKAKKPALIAKSSILLDVKPWDDETDMAKLEECVRSVVADGLLWGQSKLVPVGYGIRKLQIQCVVEDDKVGTDLLEEEITKFEDYVSTGVNTLEMKYVLDL